MTAILRRLEMVFENDGSVRSARGVYVSLDAQGADVSLGVKREADAIALIPAEARSVAEFAANTAHDAAIEDAEARVAAKALELADAMAEKDGEIETLRAQIAALSPDPSSSSVHKAYFRAALAALGHLVSVDAAVASAGTVKAELWAGATTINITDPDVIAIADALEIDLAAVMAKALEIQAGDRTA